MKKFSLLFIMLLSLMGMTQVKADELTVCDGTTTSGRVPFYLNWYDSKAQSEFIIPAIQMASMTNSEISKIKLYTNSNTAKNYGGTTTVYMTEVENTSISEFLGKDNATVVYTGGITMSSNSIEITFSSTYTYNGGNLLIGFEKPDGGSYSSASFYGVASAEQSAVAYYGSNSIAGYSFIPKVTFTYDPVVSGPGFRVLQYNNGDTFNFGLCDPSSTKSVTLQNPGTEDVTVNITTTGDFAVAESSVVVPGNKGTYELTITAPATLGAATGTVTFTPTAEGLDPVTLNITGTVKDPNKVCIDFNDNALPAEWTMTNVGNYADYYAWNFSKGYASYTGSSSSVSYTSYYYKGLVSPLMKFESPSEALLFKAKKDVNNSNYYSYIRVDYSIDGSTWTAVENGTFDNAAIPVDWTDYQVNVPAAAKMIRFVAAGVAIDDIYGGEYSTDPVMVVEANDYNLGMIDANATKTFKIKNTGKSALTDITVVSSDALFTVTDIPTSVDVNGEANVTITANYDATIPGAKNAQITVSAPEQESVQFAVAAYFIDNTLFTEKFDGAGTPEGWTNTGWTFSDGAAAGAYKFSNKYELTTPALTVAEGDKMAIEVMKTKSNGSCTLPIQVSKDGGEFTAYRTITNDELVYNEYKVFFIENLEAGSYKIKFIADDTQIGTVNGFQINNNAPEMKVTPTTDAAFGKVTANAEQTYTVENVGTGTLVVNIASDNAEFTVNPAQLTITDTPQTFTITYNYTEGNYGKKNANITVTPTYNEEVAVTIAASAQPVDPNVWDEDFEGAAMPMYWNANGWTVKVNSDNASNLTYMAYADAKGNTIITPRLQATAGQTLTWETTHNWSDEAMVVEVSSDEMVTWTQIYNYKPEDEGITTRWAKKEMEYTAAADGYYYLRFTAGYANDAIDNFNGFKVSPKDHDVVITTTNIPSTGKQFVNYTARVTVEEKVNKTEELTARFFIDGVQYGDDIVETVDALGTKQFSVTFKPEVALVGEAYFTISNEFINLETDHVNLTISAAPTFDETVEVTTVPSGTQDAVVLKYTPKQGWNTICVPFRMYQDDLKTIFGEDMKCYEFKKVENGNINFQVFETMQTYAGFAFVVYAPNPPAANEFVLTTVTMGYSTNPSQQGNEATGQFLGTYKPIDAPDMAGKWGVVPSTGRIQKGSETSSLKGLRGYFTFPEGTDASMFTLDFGDGTVITGIEAIENGLINSTDAIYDLNGRKMNNGEKLPAGVYIQNGKKLVVK